MNVLKVLATNNEYNGKCYDNCSKEFLYEDKINSFNICKCELDSVYCAHRLL